MPRESEWALDTVMPRYFGLALRNRRERAGISQARLAERAGMHRTYIGAVERGEKNISLVNAAKLAVAVGAPLWMLLFEADGPHGFGR
jgi:transcriptional regulator with XRE-family HTH domain